MRNKNSIKRRRVIIEKSRKLKAQTNSHAPEFEEEGVEGERRPGIG